jgi:hypothetical protein
MSIYTVVDEGYEVDVYRSLKGLTDSVSSSSLYVYQEDNEDAEVEATPAAIRKALRAHGEALLSDDGGRDWRYKIQKH